MAKMEAPALSTRAASGTDLAGEQEFPENNTSIRNAQAADRKLVLPTRRRGRQSAEPQAQYDEAVRTFCADLLQIQSALDFKKSGRGWAYTLEQRGVISKGEIDLAYKLINDCRSNGRLPIDFVAADAGRATIGLENLDRTSPQQEAEAIVRRMKSAHRHYWPFGFWRDQDCYVEMLVEKIGLQEMFRSVCELFNVPLTNGSGWSDISSRGEIASRFRHWESAGKTCVLLYCGDFDPAGFRISEFVRRNFEKIAGGTGWSPDKLIVDRFGLNLDFIRKHQLPWIDGLETSSGGRLDDPNHNDYDKDYVQSYLLKYGARKVEAEALESIPDQARDLCRRAILRYVEEAAVDEYRRLIAIKQKKVKRLVTKLLAVRT